MAQAEGETFEKLLEQLNLAPTEIEVFERDFQVVFQELQGEESLERFRLEYEKLHRALRNSHEQEKRLIKTCKELNTNIQHNAKNIQEASLLAQEDSETIKALKRDVNKAWKMVDAAREKEDRSKQIIHNLRLELAQLGKIVEQGAGMSVNQDNTIQELMATREELLAEREAIKERLTGIKDENMSKHSQVTKVENELMLLEQEVKNYKDSIAQHNNDADREERRKKRLDGELLQAQKKLEEIEATILQKDELIKAGKEEIDLLDQDCRDYQDETKKLEDLVNEVKQIKIGLNSKYKNNFEVNKKLEDDKSGAQIMLENAREMISKLRQENQNYARDNHADLKKNRQLENQIQEAMLQKDVAKQSVYNLGKEIEFAKKQAKDDEKLLKSLRADHEKLVKEIDGIDNVTSDQSQDAERNLKKEVDHKNDIEKNKEEVAQHAQDIWRLDKAKEKYGIEASQANSKYLHCLEEVKLKNNLIAELQKKNVEAEANLKSMQNLYETVRCDRNLYSKNLIESQDKIAELRRTFKIFHHSIEQLKEEITTKSNTLKDKQMDSAKATSFNEKLKIKKERKYEDIRIAKEKDKNLDNDINSLSNIILEADKQIEAQRKEYEKIINKRDLLGTQLIRKNDELALLYEKIKIQHNTLANGEVQYQERINDIRLLKFKMADLKREQVLVDKTVASIEDLKQNVLQLQTELLEERNKVKALSEELESPQNAQRFNVIEGQDPDKFELAGKVQALQRRLISKTEQVVEQEVLIQEKEKLLGELNQILERQPGPEVAEKLSYYQQELKKKTRLMKAMASELNMYQAQINTYKGDIRIQADKLQEFNRKYYEKKRAERDMLNA